MITLCKNGLPSGNLYEYAAYTIQNYEKKWKQLKLKEKKEMVNKYWEEKGGRDKGKNFKVKLVFLILKIFSLIEALAMGKVEII